jgi:DNA-binding NarL/FixJ family response regulator
MDLQMPDMGRVSSRLSPFVGNFRMRGIIVLTTYAGDVQALRALKAGARACVLKRRVNTELLDVIRAVHREQKHIPPEIAAELADHAAEDDLSQREIEVLRLVAAGNSNREVAAMLSIAEETVKNHVTHILAKLGANDRTHAVTIGIKRGLIDL